MIIKKKSIYKHNKHRGWKRNKKSMGFIAHQIYTYTCNEQRTIKQYLVLISHQITITEPNVNIQQKLEI